MKRTPLKRSKTPLKRSKLRKTSKEPISKLQRRIWQICKEIIRKKYIAQCYTCGRQPLEGSNWHTGHMWAKAAVGAYLKYDLRILRPQCYNCNINRGGMGADFYRKMYFEIGQEKMEELERDRQKIVNAYDHYLSLIPKYQEILKELQHGKQEIILQSEAVNPEEEKALHGSRSNPT